MEPPALSVFDAAHSQAEERWFTLGMASDDKLLAVSHTYQHTGPIHVSLRIISAREASKRERQQYENEPRHGTSLLAEHSEGTNNTRLTPAEPGRVGRTLPK